MHTKRYCFCIASFVLLYLSAYGLINKAEAETLSNGYFAKSSALIRICLGYIKLKNYDKAEKALDYGFKIAQKINEQFSRNIVLNEVAGKYILLAKYEKASKAAREIEFPDVQSVVFSNIAYYYAENGDYKKAISLIQRIKDRLLKAMLLCRIVNKLNELELYDESMEILANTVDSSCLIEKLVGVQYLERKMLKKIKKIPEKKDGSSVFFPSEQLYQKAQHLILTAKRYFALGLYEPAKEALFKAVLITKGITDKKQKKAVEEEIINLSARINSFERSLISNMLQEGLSK